MYFVKALINSNFIYCWKIFEDILHQLASWLVKLNEQSYDWWLLYASITFSNSASPSLFLILMHYVHWLMMHNPLLRVSANQSKGLNIIDRLWFVAIGQTGYVIHHARPITKRSAGLVQIYEHRKRPRTLTRHHVWASAATWRTLLSWFGYFHEVFNVPADEEIPDASALHIDFYFATATALRDYFYFFNSKLAYIWHFM